MAKPKVSKETQQLFLKLLNFTPELLAKAQHEANLREPVLMPSSAQRWRNI